MLETLVDVFEMLLFFLAMNFLSLKSLKLKNELKYVLMDFVWILSMFDTWTLYFEKVNGF